jgi:hypothetical protein
VSVVVAGTLSFNAWSDQLDLVRRVYGEPRKAGYAAFDFNHRLGGFYSMGALFFGQATATPTASTPIFGPATFSTRCSSASSLWNK